MNRQGRDRHQGCRAPDDRRGQPHRQMLYPLPSQTVAAWQAYQDQEPRNPGLIFDRFAPDWGREPRGERHPWKKRGLSQVVTAAKHIDLALLSAWNARWKAMVTAAAAESFTLWTDWRLVAGLGRGSAYEVGFTFHRYGFPILPGSSVKGLARAAGLAAIAEKLGEVDLNRLDSLLSLDDPQKFSEQKLGDLAESFRAIFGTTTAAGKAVFFDAIPVQRPQLELDIMNPHYPQYYQGSEPPADWQSPIPVYFLTVAPGSEFRFAVGWRGPLNETGKALQAQAVAWLKMGLMELGAGGKTSAGYGYFTNRQPTQRAQAPAVSQPVSRQRAQPSLPRPTPSQARPSPPAPSPAPVQRTVAPQRQPAPDTPSPESEELGTWRTGTVTEPWSQRGWGVLTDEVTGEKWRFRLEAIENRSQMPGKNAKVEYLIAEREGRPTVVRVRRQQ